MTPRATARLWPSIVTAALATAGLAAAQLGPSAPRPVHTAIRIAQPDAAQAATVRALALDEWSEHAGPGLPLDVVVDRADLAALAAAGIAWEVLVDDIDAAAAAEHARLADPTAQRPGDWFGEYHDYAQISWYLEQLAAVAPDRVSLHRIGTSLEGRPIWALRIAGTGAATSTMLIGGTQHAREWIAAATSTCVADRLVRDYARDPGVRGFLDRTTTWIVPVVNPDGYQYSWTTSRYWRKNRRDGHGVDLNRNWGVAWGGPGSSGNKRSDIYRGEAAFSEPESAALRDLALREKPRLAIDFHAYGQLVLYPWNYTQQRADDHAQLVAVGERMGAAIYAQHEKRYTVMSGVDLYPAAGTAQDFMYGALSALSYTIELRPKGGSGFVLPPEQIRPTCDEGLAAVLALGSAPAQ